MNELPVPASPALPVATLDPADAAVDRFLARVAALTPAQWGALDAAGQRLQGGDPIARWRRARYYAAAAAHSTLLHDVFTVVIGAGEAIFEATVGLSRALDGRRRVARRPPQRPVVPPLGADRFARASRELFELMQAAPGGYGAASLCLTMAHTALQLRAKLPAAAFAEMYAPVEPVIPAASL